MYQRIAKPMFEEADINHDALVTQRGGHAQERMDTNDRMSKEEKLLENNNGNSISKTKMVGESINIDSEIKDISEYNAIIAMGGDGILFEIFQSIHDQLDEETIISKMKLGIVACGTFNGLVKSILHWSGSNNGCMELMF